MKFKTIAIALCTVAFGSVAFAQHANFAHPKLTAKFAKDAALKACVTSNAALDKAIDDAFAKAKAAGKIDAKEEAEFKAREAGIAKHRAALATDGFTLKDCQTMTADYNAEKAAVERMGGVIAARAATPVKVAAPAANPELAACRTANASTHTANMELMSKARAAKKITPAEETEFKKFEQGAAMHNAMMARDGYSLADCKARAADLVKEKALIEKLAK